MKAQAAVLGAALWMLAAGTANAANTWIGLTGGAGIPTGNYGDVASTGWNIGATGTHMVNGTWGFGGDLAYQAWSGSDTFNQATAALYGPGSEINWSAIQATAHTKLAFQTQGNAKPYAKAGFGIYSVTSKLTSPSGNSDTSRSKLGFNMGAGMNFLTSGNMNWGFAGSYHIVPTKDDFGADANFFTLGVNLMWGVGH